MSESTDTKTIYLFGQPIAHSVSPFFYNTIFTKLSLPWRYIRLDSHDPEDLMWMMRRDDFMGAAVTMPNKVRAMACVDVLTEEARRIGCINTIYVQSGHGGDGERVLVGTNTDWIGIQRALLRAQPKLKEGDWSAMVIGGGATCKSAIYALAEGLVARTIYLVSRDAGEAQSAIDDLKQRGLQRDICHIDTVEDVTSLSLSETPIVTVSAVPDIAPKTEPEQRARDIAIVMLQRKPGCQFPRIFLEMCYDPRPRTWLAGVAGEADWQIIDGLDVMEHQAIEQDVLWMGRSLSELPVNDAGKAIRDALHRH
ncbi:hypothetical protein ASPWEDRAFT_49559 [Aspergillus wentii DTO 134E9]|uniref:Shikimate dehydrogenase substrate binding N-terminal domain-containing protein n=1 Tax=Aspergillus wentii DTO 134E9 TaxID=1073089 RepID=A0A1L9RXH4_ASPWE|nr:uncharacterized protein ASPWEDRAFT_49559 [Aspergillus wentii DTO 134E9]KAI9931707.1 hypothetical protein MW887_010286 [Aspergillus wentii]OJJ39615.1 hypothetical protein ASPWEDRAFT_49559 [Aspergillus wentii DTO 134E9]